MSKASAFGLSPLRLNCRISTLLLCLLLVGCARTHFRQTGPCLRALEPQSMLLVPWLPEKNTEFYLKGLQKIYKKQNIEIAYAEEQEWNLRASGVTNPMDSSTFSLLKKTGFTHLLLLKEISSRSESTYASYTPLEVSQGSGMYGYKPSWQEQGNQSEISLQLVPLNDVKATHTVIAKTIISHLMVRHKNKGESHINLTTVESARYKAMVKASKRMLEGCGVD